LRGKVAVMKKPINNPLMGRGEKVKYSMTRLTNF